MVADDGYGIDELKDIISPIADVCGVRSVYLFGSRAKGTFDKNSDYDLAISVDEGFNFHDYCRFTERLSDALKAPVDVIFMEDLKDDRFGRRVMGERKHVCGEA